MTLGKRYLAVLLPSLPWLIAGTMLCLDLDAFAAASSPIAPRLTNVVDALQAFALVGGRIALYAIGVYSLLAVFGLWLWKQPDLRPIAPLLPYLALIASGSIGPHTFSALILPAFLLLTPLAAWASRAGEAAQRAAFVSLPLTLSLWSLLGIAYGWLGHNTLRELIGAHLQLSLAFFALACLIAALPALRANSVLSARLGYVLAGAWFIWQHAFDEHFSIYASHRLLGSSASYPHVILIVADTLRGDSLSYRNPSAPVTPSIDRLASESVNFENAISPSSWTFPAMTSLMTAISPLQSLALDDKTFAYQTAAAPTLAEILADHGYRTSAILGNPLMYRPFRVTAGLDRIDSYSDGIFGSRSGSSRLREPDDAIPQSYTTRVLTDRAIDWARNLPDEQPSFLWLHYLDPHYPYLPPAKHIGPTRAAHPEQVMSLNQLYWVNAQYPQPGNLDILRRLYLDEVQFVDEQIGRFLDVLQEEGIAENSIIVFVSDHGEGFGEHGRILHGFELYQELLHVPLLIRLPGGARPTRVSSFVPTGALVPTLVELLKLDTQPRPGWPASLVPLMADNAAPYDHPIVSGANQKGEPQWSIILGGMKYVFQEATATEAVYDLNADPGEQRPMKNPPEPFLSEARAALKQHFEFAERTLAQQGLSRDPAQDKAIRDRMKSLGYLQ